MFEVQLMLYRTNLGSKTVGLLEVLARTNGERAQNACDIDDRKRKVVQTILVACSEAGGEAHLVGSLSHKTQIAKSKVDVACLFPAAEFLTGLPLQRVEQELRIVAKSVRRSEDRVVGIIGW